MTPKRSHKKRNLIIALIVVILLIPAVIWAVYWFATPQQSTKNTTNTTVVDSAESIINKINAKLTDTSSKNHRKATITQSTPLSDTPASGPSYKVGKADYYVSTTETYGLSITKQGMTAESSIDEDFNQTVTDQIVSVLSDADYKMSDTTDIANYESATVVCNIAAEGSPVAVTCANKSAYTKISDNLKPFVTAYTSVTSDNADIRTTYSDLTITNSEVAKYQHASVNVTQGMSGAVLLFYRFDEGTWKFFKGTQNILSCTEYNTVEITSAFKGEKCMDGETESTVDPIVGPIFTPATADKAE